jgi:hypothetical protein
VLTGCSHIKRSSKAKAAAAAPVLRGRILLSGPSQCGAGWRTQTPLQAQSPPHQQQPHQQVQQASAPALQEQQH